MTEPNVLGNSSVGKFLWESGNTQIINLWKDAYATNNNSLHSVSAGTALGVVYQIPVGKVLWLLSFCIDRIAGGSMELDLQSNTTPDTATGGTTQQKFSSSADDIADERNCLIKFVAGEYVTPIVNVGADYWCTAYGVECDA